MTDRRPIYQRLREFYSDAEADAWIYSPHPQLDGLTPAFVIDQCAGGEETVHEIVDRMADGVFL